MSWWNDDKDDSPKKGLFETSTSFSSRKKEHDYNEASKNIGFGGFGSRKCNFCSHDERIPNGQACPQCGSTH